MIAPVTGGNGYQAMIAPKVLIRRVASLTLLQGLAPYGSLKSSRVAFLAWLEDVCACLGTLLFVVKMPLHLGRAAAMEDLRCKNLAKTRHQALLWRALRQPVHSLYRSAPSIPVSGVHGVAGKNETMRACSLESGCMLEICPADHPPTLFGKTGTPHSIAAPACFLLAIARYDIKTALKQASLQCPADSQAPRAFRALENSDF